MLHVHFVSLCNMTANWCLTCVSICICVVLIMVEVTQCLCIYIYSACILVTVVVNIVIESSLHPYQIHTFILQGDWNCYE